MASLNLIVNKERNKVFFAQARKGFVDVLFSFLTLPLRTIARLVAKESNTQPIEVGSLSSLYQSVKNLDKGCLNTDTCKEMLLQPRNSMEAYCKNLLLNIDDTPRTEYFVCNDLVKCRHRSPVLLSTSRNKICRCGNMLAKPISPPSSNNVFGGFVKRNATFIITDDLKVVPDSLDTIFHLLKNCGVEDVSLVDQMTVTITTDQVMNLLKSCLHSETPLTDLFLEKDPCLERFKKIKLLPSYFNAYERGRINVKIMQRKSNGKILFVQGKEDFADFLFSFLTFPLGAVVHLMGGRSCLGSIDGLYKSVVDLDENYWTTKEVKNKLVDLKLAPQFKSSKILPIYQDSNPVYFCKTMHTEQSGYGERIKLTSCYLTSTFEEDSKSYGTCIALELVDPMSAAGKSKGYAKGLKMYMATDDLVVTPFSSMFVLTSLNSMGIPLSDLEEKLVSIGVNEGISILQASLTSTSALTTGLSHLLTNDFCTLDASWTRAILST